MSLRSYIKNHVPWSIHYAYRKIYYAPKDVPAALDFMFHGTKSPTTFAARARFIKKCYAISYYVDCPHTEHEIIVIARRILDLGADIPGVIVEAGSFHGGSTAKLSVVANMCNRELEVFDSFEGMPENNETHGKSIYGREHHFPKGSHAVGIEEVRGNVSIFGDVSRTSFHKGFFNITMPDFHKPVFAACVNVDLVQSTKDCLRYLYPLISRGGFFVSQDGHFPWIIELLRDNNFWKDEMHIEPPHMEGLGNSKFVFVRK